MLKMSLGINATGWMAKSDAVKEVVRTIPLVLLRWKGTHSFFRVPNEQIAADAIAHGDDIWGIEKETLTTMARKVRDGLIAVARGNQTDIRRQMIQCINIAVAGLKTTYLEGKISGPARSAFWNAWKARTFGAPTPNMVASREWLNSLTGSLEAR